MNSRWFRTLWIVVALLGPVISAGAQASWTVALDSLAFGTVDLGWEAAQTMPGGRWGWGLGVQVPVFLWSRGGGIDTGAAEIRGLWELSGTSGWFLRSRVGTGLAVQTQVLGTLTSWTGRASLEPGYRDDWGEVWFRVEPTGALATHLRPSAYTAHTFEDRYEGAPSASGSVLWGAALRCRTGLGAEVRLAPGLWGTVEAGVFPPWRTEVGWMDGFSFGEIPFFASLGCRFSP